MNSSKITMKTARLALSALAAAAILSVTASAQLTLDNFPTGSDGNYVKSLTAPSGAVSSATHTEPLPAGSPLGAGRWTNFIVASPYAQSSTVDVGNSILIVDSGFQNETILQMFYGVNVHGKQAPMGLNLGAYSGFQLNFAGSLSAPDDLAVLVEVWPSSGGYYISLVDVPPSYYPFSVAFPYTSFTPGGGGSGGLTSAQASDISYIEIQFYSGYNQTYGVTSFQAY